VRRGSNTVGGIARLVGGVSDESRKKNAPNGSKASLAHRTSVTFFVCASLSLSLLIATIVG